MSARPSRVLVTDISSYKAVVVAAYLRRCYPHIEVLTCDVRRVTRWLHTKQAHRHFVLSRRPEEAESYVEALAELIRREEIGLCIPVNSKEMRLLLAHRERIGPSLDYWGTLDSFVVLDDKAKLAALAATLDLRMPREFSGTVPDRFPVVVKPAVSAAAEQVSYVDDAAAWTARFGVSPAPAGWIVQERVAGRGAGYSVFARAGEVLRGYGHIRLAEFPVSGGSSVYRAGLRDDRLAGIAGKVVRATRWSGFAMFEFKIAPSGEIWLLEVNPRIWGSINQGLQEGVNYFEPLLGPSPCPVAPRSVRTYISPLAHLALLTYASRGRMEPLREFLGHLSVNVPDVGLFSDWKGWCGSLVRTM
jgi:hypothetical protein